MINKKYYLISEVAEILKLPIYKLRYLEKVNDDINIHKLKNRRYYTQADIEKLKIYCKVSVNDQNSFKSKFIHVDIDDFIKNVEKLIKNFNKAKQSLNCYIDI